MNNIRMLRKDKMVTLKEVAKVIGVAESTMSLYESGKRQPDQEILKKLADYFGVTLDYLLGRDVELLHIPDNLKGIPVAFHNGIEDLSQDDIDDVAKFIEFLKAKNKK